jgi:2-dehydro-3-deoxygluconokinase
MIDWDKVLHDVSWFNFSAISPALTENVADVCLEAVEAASAKGITISVDLNYRSRLWKYGKQPIEVMPRLVQHCDVVMGNIWAANTLLGTAIDEEIHNKKGKESYIEHAEATSKEIIQKFPKCKVVANTFRFDKKELLYYTTMYKDGQQYTSSEFTTERVVDRSGSGDCFMAGLIYGLYNQHAPQDIVNYAAAAAFGKLQEEGDATGHDILTVAQIETENKEA